MREVVARRRAWRGTPGEKREVFFQERVEVEGLREKGERERGRRKKKASISKKIISKNKKLTEPSRRGLIQVRDRAPRGEVEVETLVGEGLVGLFVWWRRGGREGKRREKA